MALKILKHDMDGQTGLLIFRVRAEERSENGMVTWSPEETVSIYPRALANILTAQAGMTEEKALTSWLGDRHKEILERKQLKERFAEVARKFSGQTLNFDQPDLELDGRL